MLNEEMWTSKPARVLMRLAQQNGTRLIERCHGSKASELTAFIEETCLVGAAKTDPFRLPYNVPRLLWAQGLNLGARRSSSACGWWSR
jgi:hypothetical protein